MQTVIYFGSVRQLVAMPQFDGSQNCASAGDFGYHEENISGGAATRLNAEFKRVCQDCSYVDACKEYAIAHELHGVWGGTTPHERAAMRRKMGITVTSPDEIQTVFYRRLNVNTTQAKGEFDGLAHMDDLVPFDVLSHPLDGVTPDVHVA
jgi:Ni,Fe-hydrogenase I large subunit